MQQKQAKWKKATDKHKRLGFFMNSLHTVEEDEPLCQRVERLEGEERRRCVCVSRRREHNRGGELAHLERNATCWRSAARRVAATSVCRQSYQRRELQPGRGAPGSHTAPAVTHSLPGRCGCVGGWTAFVRLGGVET